MKLDYNAWQFWLTVAVVIGNIGVLIYTWVSNRNKAQTKDIKEIKEDVQDVETRVTKLEAGSISHGDLSKVYDRINDVGKGVSKLEGSINGLQESVGLIHQHLLDSGGGKQ